jgi:hypothetical protein
VGILLGWIVRRRWLTLGAVVLCVIGLVAIPRLPVPTRTIWVVLPAVLFAAITYEGAGTLLGVTLFPRLRLWCALCEGAAVLALAVGITFSDSDLPGLLGAVVVFVVLYVAGLIPLAVSYRRQVRNRANAPVTKSASR